MREIPIKLTDLPPVPPNLIETRDKEVEAMATLTATLEKLDRAARWRVATYLFDRYVGSEVKP